VPGALLLYQEGPRGTGLGLAMVYGMMERHEGTIQIDSEVDKGTTVRLIFPLRTPPKSHEAPPPTAQFSPSVFHVLCIDDEPLLRELLKEALSIPSQGGRRRWRSGRA